MWTITKDLIAEADAKPGTNRNAVGIVGPRNAKLTADEIKNHPDAVQFRMYDDDNELYYEGYLIGDEFAPLDAFGTPNAGCTRIDVYDKKARKWVTV